MAGKVGSGSFAILLVDGYDFLASKLQGFSHKVEAIQEKSDGLGDTTEAQTPVGLSRVTVAQTGAFFDDSANGAHVLLSPAGNTAVSRVMFFAFAGNVIGKLFVGIQGLYVMAYEPIAKVAGLTKANATYQASGLVERGAILTQQVAKTANWNTKTDGNSVDYALDPSQQVIPITSNSAANPSVVTTPMPHGLTTGQIVLISGVVGSIADINGQQTVTVISPTTFSVPVNAGTHAGAGGSFVRCSTVSGGAGYQLVSAMTGFTGFIGKVRDSPDDITYGDLVTFGNVTVAPAAERNASVADQTVDRYLCYTGTVTGAGSITAVAGFARS